MAPMFWMALTFLMMVSLRLMATAPRAKTVDTIMGSIWGVRPTAMLMENRKALSPSRLVITLSKKTRGTITSIKRMRMRLTEARPLSKAEGSGLTWLKCPAIWPSTVSSPVE